MRTSRISDFGPTPAACPYWRSLTYQLRHSSSLIPTAHLSPWRILWRASGASGSAIHPKQPCN